MSPNNPVFRRWNARLDNWALWLVGQSGSASSACDGNWGEGVPRPPPPLVGEALDTDDLVTRLSPPKQDAVKAMYVHIGTVDERAAELGIGRKALDERVDQAMFDLEEMWRRKQVKAGIPDKTQIRSTSCESPVV